MDQRSATAVTFQPQVSGSPDTLDRLSLTGWRGGLAALVAGLVLSFLLFGYFVIFWRNADMDFMVIYNAFLLNDGKPQHYFDHPAYLTILALSSWFRLLHTIGLLDAWSLSAMPPAADAAAFEAAMTHAVRAGRVLSLLIATGCVLVFAGLMRPIVRDWRLALLAAQAFALSGGIAVHSRILRSELVAACPVIFALLVLIVAGRRAHVARPLALAVAAVLCVLGLQNKVQAILLIGVLPLLILPFGAAESASAPFWRNARTAWPVAAAAFAMAIATMWLAWPLLATGFDRALLDAAEFHPLLAGRYGVYQAALLVLIVGCMIAYAALWRVSVAETFASIAAVVAGASIALLALNIEYNASNVIAVINPLEKMLAFADASGTDAAAGSALSMLALWLQGIASVLARYSFVLSSSSRPTVFLVWLIIPGIVWAWRRGKRQAAIQAMMLLAVAIGVDALGVRRGLKAEYFIFTDPLIILAGAILLNRCADLALHRLAYPIGATLILLHLTVGQAEPVKHAFQRGGPEAICEWHQWYLPLMPLPWCAEPPRRS
jgi:hypothetical protein